MKQGTRLIITTIIIFTSLCMNACACQVHQPKATPSNNKKTRKLSKAEQEQHQQNIKYALASPGVISNYGF